jgi:hypothetical protein
LPEHVIAPYKKKRGEERLTGRRWDFNNAHAWYRATIEHCFAFVKRSVEICANLRWKRSLSMFVDDHRSNDDLR